MRRALIPFIPALILLASCGADSTVDDPAVADNSPSAPLAPSENDDSVPPVAQTPTEPTPPETSPPEVIVDPAPQPVSLNRFELANQCFAIQSAANQSFLVKQSDGSHSATAVSPDAASAYFMKPSALGKYMIFTQDEFLMQGTASGVSSAQAFGDDIEWTVAEAQGVNSFTLTNTASGQRMALNSDSALLGSSAAANSADQIFQFVKTGGCTAFPEISTNTSGDTYTIPSGKKIKGFADVHNHITATTFLGGAHHGWPHHRFGVTEALGNCQANHGPDGRLDLVDNLFKGQPQATHDTQGWPTFNDWPGFDALTHEGLYYKWFERAWKAGLRIFVTNLVENETLCTLVTQAKNVQNQTLNFAAPPLLPAPLASDPNSPCNEMKSAIEQIDYAKSLVDYIDAQEGGPGKGWLRIVTTPQEAREVIQQGKLAMVLGIEISHLFNCNITRAGPNCSEEKIDQELERLWDLGVRQMFPIHEFNNAFGGNGLFNGDILNVGNFYDTGAFWETYDCPGADNNYADFLNTPGANMTSLPGLGNDPLTAQVLANNPGVAPLYPTDRRQCNKFGLTPLGQYAFRKMMEKGVILEVDHLELSIKQDLIELGERQVPPYPLVSTHGAQGGLSKEQARRMIAAGGIVFPYQGNAQSWADTFERISELKSQSFDFAMGFGADTNGLGAQAGPRGADRPAITYPFTLFQGPEWEGVFEHNVAPVIFDQQKSGERLFDANSEGQAHYGLKADWVEEVKLEGGNEALKALYNSAEVYIQMWERTMAKRTTINP